MSKFCSFIAVIALLSSCTSALFPKGKVLEKGSKFYILENGATSTWDIVEYKTKRNIPLEGDDKVEIKDDHLKVTINNKTKGWISKIANVSKSTKATKDFTGNTDFRRFYQNTNENMAYFIDKDHTDKDDYLKISEKPKKSWKLAAITITAKNRFLVTKEAPSDSFPSTWETKFSPGLAVSNELFKWTSVSGKGKINQTSLNLGGILALGAQEISSKTTRPKYDFSRKALSITGGIVLNLDINKFDTGVYFGAETALGEGAGNWVYQWMPNWGFIFGFDLVKGKK